MMANATAFTRRSSLVISGGATGASMPKPGPPPKQAGWSNQEDDRHDDEHHRIRRLRVEHLRQPFDDAEHEAGQDRAKDRSHAADHYDREDDGDDVRAHARTDLVDRRGEHAGERRKG